MKELQILKQQLSFELENNPTFKKLKKVEAAIKAYEEVLELDQKTDVNESKAKFMATAKKYLREMAGPIPLAEIKKVTGEESSVRVTRYLMGDKDFTKVGEAWTLKEFLEEGVLPNLNR